MTDIPDLLDLNTAGEQRNVIPANTIVTLQLTIRPGGAGDDGWLKRSGDGKSEGIDAEFTVVDGPFAKRKFWQRYTLSGTTPGHAEAGQISRNALRAILESARGIRPDDKSETAVAARKLTGWADLDQIRFIAKLGVQPPQGSFPAKNTILTVITPEQKEWVKLEQIAKTTRSVAEPPANAIARPQWAAS
jgi:hypothetical protein